MAVLAQTSGRADGTPLVLCRPHTSVAGKRLPCAAATDQGQVKVVLDTEEGQSPCWVPESSAIPGRKGPMPSTEVYTQALSLVTTGQAPTLVEAGHPSQGTRPGLNCSSLPTALSTQEQDTSLPLSPPRETVSPTFHTRCLGPVSFRDSSLSLFPLP